MQNKQEESLRVVAISVIAVVPIIALAVHWWLKRNDTPHGLDLISLGLVGVFLLPFLAALLQSAKLGDWELHFVQKQVDALDAEVHLMRFLVESFLTSMELEHLQRLAENRPITAKMNYYPDRFKDELFRLWGIGFIKSRPGMGMTKLFAEDGPNARDVHQYYYITEKGRQFLALRAGSLEKQRLS